MFYAVSHLYMPGIPDQAVILTYKIYFAAEH